MSARAETEPDPERASSLTAFKSNAWTDLALTLPIFVGYHLGVVTLNVRNAADPLTTQLIALAKHDVATYWALTVVIGAGMVMVMWMLGRDDAFEGKRFAVVAAEGVVYAVLMRGVAAYAVGALPLAPWLDDGRWAGLIISLGAGFYEEIVFRVGLFGLGALAIRMFFGGVVKLTMVVGWAIVAAALFSAWHYVGDLGDAWDLRTFVFRWVCGLAFTAIYALRGFAPAVWTHALYDIWVLVLR